MRELFLVEQKNVTRYADITVSQLQDTLETSTGLFWLDIEQMTDEDAALLQEFKEFRFHSLAIKECREPAGRSYLEEFPEYLFMMFSVQEEMEAEPTKVCVFLTPDYLVTVHATPLAFLQRVKDRIEQDYLMMRSPGYSMALMLHGLVDQVEGVAAQLGMDMTVLGDEMEEGAGQEHLQTIGRHKRRVAVLRRALKAYSEAVHTLFSRSNAQMQPETLIQIRSVYHRLAGIGDALDFSYETLEEMRGTALARMSQQVNASIGRLTSVAAVFLPVVAVAALLGINDRLVPGLDPLVTVGVGVFISIVVGGIVAVAARQR
jgi:magnesium transporter